MVLGGSLSIRMNSLVPNSTLPETDSLSEVAADSSEAVLSKPYKEKQSVKILDTTG